MKPGDLVVHKYTHDAYINSEKDPLFRSQSNTIMWEYKKVGIIVSIGSRDGNYSILKWVGVLTPNGLGYCYEDRLRRA